MVSASGMYLKDLALFCCLSISFAPLIPLFLVLLCVLVKLCLILEPSEQVHTTLDLAMQDVAEKVVRDGGVEYDNERVLLGEKAIERCVEALDILVLAREQKMEQASLVAATR